MFETLAECLHICVRVCSCVAELTNVAGLAGMKSPLPVTPYPNCHGIFLFVIVPVFWVENNDQHLSEACHPLLSYPRLYPDLEMPPRWAHLARRPSLFVCLAQSMTLCREDGKVVAAPDLTSHPSFCLMPGHWGCDDWITHIYSQLDKWASTHIFQHIDFQTHTYTHTKETTLTHTVKQTLGRLISRHLSFLLCYIFQLFDGYRCCSQHLLVLSGKPLTNRVFLQQRDKAFKEITLLDV